MKVINLRDLIKDTRYPNRYVIVTEIDRDEHGVIIEFSGSCRFDADEFDAAYTIAELS